MGPLGYALYLLSVVAVAIVAAFALATRYDVSRFFSGNLSVRNNTPASAVAERTPANPASGDSMSFLKVQGEAPRIIINRG